MSLRQVSATAYGSVVRDSSTTLVPGALPPAFPFNPFGVGTFHVQPLLGLRLFSLAPSP